MKKPRTNKQTNKKRNPETKKKKKKKKKGGTEECCGVYFQGKTQDRPKFFVTQLSWLAPGTADSLCQLSIKNRTLISKEEERRPMWW